MSDSPYADNRIDYIINLLNPSKKDRVLNIGISNIPEIEMKLEKRVKECWTMDFDKQKLERAKKYLRKTKLINADIFGETSLKNNYFDKIVIVEVLEHLKDDGKAVDLVRHLLKKGGVVVAASPNKALLHLVNPVKYFEHERHYSNYEFKKLFLDRRFIIRHFNVVENWELLVNLYVHLFFKFILKKLIPFNTFDKYSKRTYMRQNKSGLDIILKAEKTD